MSKEAPEYEGDPVASSKPAAKASTIKVDKPSLAPVILLFAGALLLVAAGVALIVNGAALLGIGFALLGLAPVALFLVLANAIVDKAMEGMGQLLGGSGSAPDMSPEAAKWSILESNKHLIAEKLAVVQANLEQTDALARPWFERVRGDFDAIDLTAEDGVRLVGHVLHSDVPSNKWLVFAHGIDGSWKTGTDRARRFHARGYNVLLLSMRAQGESGGTVVGAGHLERRDIVNWCRWICERDVDARIVLFGESLGGAAVLEAAGERDLAPQVKCVVSDSAYADFWNECVHVLSEEGMDGKTVPAHPLLDLVRLLFRARPGGYDLADCSAEASVAHADVPILLAHGRDDRLVPVSHALRLDAAMGGSAAGKQGHELLVIPNAGHCSAALADPYTYYEHVFAFAEKHVG